MCTVIFYHVWAVLKQDHGFSNEHDGPMRMPRYGLVSTNGVTVKDFNEYYQLTTAEATPRHVQVWMCLVYIYVSIFEYMYVSVHTYIYNIYI